MALLGTLLGVFLAWKLVIALTAGLLFPLFWIWMVVDAVLRDTSGFRSGSTNEKLIWILVIAFLHVAAVVYFFVIWLPARKRAAAPETATVAA
jgi:hypothetical protein